MITYKAAIVVAASALVMLSTGITQAQQKLEEAGRDVVTHDYQSYEQEKGHNFTFITENGVTVTDDPSHPLNMSAVDCKGMVDEFSDGKYKGYGYCTNTDRDGDKLVSRWNVSSDAKDSHYEVTAGTGKFEGAKGEGTAAIIEVIPGPKGRQIARWKGTGEYPKLRK